MGAQLKSIVTFVGLAPNASQSLPHGLQRNGIGLVPDVLSPGSSAPSTITADMTNVTVTNNGADALTISVLCESWHTFERAFGGAQTVALSPQPFVVANSRAGSGVYQTNGGNGGGAIGAGIAGSVPVPELRQPRSSARRNRITDGGRSTIADPRSARIGASKSRLQRGLVTLAICSACRESCASGRVETSAWSRNARDALQGRAGVHSGVVETSAWSRNARDPPAVPPWAEQYMSRLQRGLVTLAIRIPPARAISDVCRDFSVVS